MSEIICPNCGSPPHRKKNGHIHHGKQNYRCKVCGRQFVLNKQHNTIPEPIKVLIQKALLERNSLRGICRIFSVSWSWNGWNVEFRSTQRQQAMDMDRAGCAFTSSHRLSCWKPRQRGCPTMMAKNSEKLSGTGWFLYRFIWALCRRCAWKTASSRH